MMNKRKRCEYVSRWRATRRRVDDFFQSIPDFSDSDSNISGNQHNLNSEIVHEILNLELANLKSAFSRDLDINDDVDSNTVGIADDQSAVDELCNGVDDRSLKKKEGDFNVINDSSVRSCEISNTWQCSTTCDMEESESETMSMHI